MIGQTVGNDQFAIVDQSPTGINDIRHVAFSLILARCIFRLVEYSMGNASYLIAHEWTLYVFDAVPMFMVLVLLLILQPTKYIPSKSSDATDSNEGLETARQIK